MALLWGIDLGGSKIEGVVTESTNPLKPITRQRIKTESDQGYQHIIKRIAHLVFLLCDSSGAKPAKIGFGTPGICDQKTSLMKNCNTTCLNGMPLKSDLEKELGVIVELSNDANCFTLAESKWGAAKNSSSTFGVIMGTGVGGGIVFENKIINGKHGIAGEWGHNVLVNDGQDCYCGKKGCVETVISGPALEKYYFYKCNNKLTLQQIIEASKTGDLIAKETVEHLTKNFGKAIANVINILDPECIVLGGGLSNIEDLYSEGIAEASKNVFNNTLYTKIVKNELGDSAGVFGAALLSQCI